ncbi:MAG: ABC transporter substrate-binding protein [Bryobacteraceae bacterium]|nr:ABC transporter substrate-binding protein [Bryobacteraceae bacterium]
MPLHVRAAALTLLIAGTLSPQTTPCACGVNPPGRPAARELRPYAAAPDDMRPFSKFTTPHYEHYTNIVEYNGPGRDEPVPALSTLDEIRIGFLGPLENHPDQALGQRMLNGVTLAIEEANKAGGYCGKPFRLMLHNDQAVWGSASNEIVKMVYDEKVWAIFGSISGDSTHIALRVALKAEVPMVNSAATDPTIPETIIPWYLTVLQDDRVQSYTLARRIYTDLGLSRVAILRINDRYGRFGVGKFKDASRRLGHPVVIEQKYLYGDTDFARQLRVIQDSRVDAVVLWGDAAPAAAILKQMRSLGMKQRVFGSFRVLGPELLEQAGDAAEGLEAVFPYDPTRAKDPLWQEFQARFKTRFHAAPETFASLGYDAMKVLLDAICRAGLNRAVIRDALTGLANYRGVTGEMTFDPNAKNIAPMYLAKVENRAVTYRRYPMDKPYARSAEKPAEFNGPVVADAPKGALQVILFGPHPAPPRSQEGLAIIPVDSQTAWGKASSELVKLLYDERTIAIVATARDSSHLALQLGNKLHVPVIALSDDTSLTSMNLPWILRMPAGTPVEEALRRLTDTLAKSGPNRERLARLLTGAP